jgi:hypothetical protein
VGCAWCGRGLRVVWAWVARGVGVVCAWCGGTVGLIARCGYSCADAREVEKTKAPRCDLDRGE